MRLLLGGRASKGGFAHASSGADGRYAACGEKTREEGEAGVLVHFHSLMPVSGDFFFLFMY